mgnify:CR=1 FL=1
MEGYTSKPLLFLLMTSISLLQFIFILRFLFEITKVNFYNPVCQLIVKITNPFLMPLRLLPLYIGRIDLVIIILITMITALKIYTPYYFTSFEYSFNSLFIAAFGKFIQETLDILWYAVIIGAIGSWFMSYNAHPMFTLIDEMCEPFYKPIRKILPVMTGIDFSPIILLIAINLIQMIILPPIFYLTKFF